MRWLHLTDTHLGHSAFFEGAPDDYRRADDHFDAVVQALQPALRGEVDAVIHSGDVFHRSRPPAREVERACALFAAVAKVVPVYVIAGNHDRRGVSRHFFARTHGLTVIDQACRFDIGGVAAGFVPYQRTAEAFGLRARALGALDLLVCHQAFDGVRVPSGDGDFVFRHGRQRDTAGPDALRHVTAVACGHIHPRQVVQVGGVPVVHPGSTERTAFSEADETKGFAVWCFEGEVSWRFQSLRTRRMVRVRRHADLGRVAPGALVSAKDPELVLQARSRGAYTLPLSSRSARRQVPTRPRQLGLF